MIKLKDILQETWYGKLLWADPGFDSSSMTYHALLQKAYGNELEPDTPREREVWIAIRDYLKGDYNRYTGLGSAREVLPDLAKLKKRFPEILDPGLLIASGDPVYRAMTWSTADLARLIEAESGKGLKLEPGNDWYSIEGLSMAAKSRNRIGFISMTYKLSVARDFYGLSSYPFRYGVILECPYSAVQSQALMNPDWLRATSGMDESEFWVLGNQIPVARIWFRNPGTSASRIQPREAARIQQALDRANA